MLLGNYQSKLDLKKGRIAVPVKFRQKLGKKVIITLGHEKSLLLIAKDQWKQVTADITNRPFISEPARQIDRYLLGNAYECNLDEQGRILLPANLRDYAQLGKQIVFVGMGNRVELWSQALWEKQLVYLKTNISQITARLDEKND